MARSFRLPDLGEGIHEGEVVQVLVKVGDRVTEDEPILEIETDKAAVEIPSPFSGTVEAIHVKAGDVVRVGDEMIVFGGEERPEGAEAVEAAGVATAGEAAERAVSEPGPEYVGPVPASPATRRLARELGVDLRKVHGTGPAGRVTGDDVRAFAVRPPGLREKLPEEAPPPVTEPEPARTVGEALTTGFRPSGVEVPPLPDFGRWGPVERVPLRSVRRSTAKHMALAWSQIPHVNHQDWADVTDLELLRQHQKEAIEARGGKLTLTVFIMKAVVAALKAYPQFNTTLDADREEIIFKRYYHIGVAADTERGLVVPVVRNVDRKSVMELALELTEVVGRAREGKSSLEELQGGTFTITNIGALGGTGFAPIVNYPEVAILGLGKAQLQPTVRGTLEEHEIVVRLRMPLVLAFDHRVADGAEAARFVNKVIELLESPERLLMAI
jgi:pyruvate dehydrogenase E2 component (dihydrolipoamide acetyltransferase)